MEVVAVLLVPIVAVAGTSGKFLHATGFKVVKLIGWVTITPINFNAYFKQKC